MRALLKCAFLVCLVLLLAAGNGDASGAPSHEELSEKPAAAFLAGKNVNVRDQPSTNGKVLGRMGDDDIWEELVIIGAAPGEDGQIWYHILSEKLGEGWMHGRFLRFDGLADPIWRFFMLIRRDIGTNPEMTERKLGKPLRVERQTFRPEDFHKDVTSVELFYPVGSVIYWIMDGVPFLTTVDFEEHEGGIPGFGPIRFGDEPDKVEQLLGDPHGVRNWVWTYHSGMRRVHIGFKLDANSDVKVERLIFERDAY